MDKSHHHDHHSEEIAVIGMAGQFPGSFSIEAFWENLKKGKDLITFFSEEEGRVAGLDPRYLRSPDYVRAKGILKDADCFDASLFGYSAREAESIDPQQRMLLQWSWAALEDACYDPEQYQGLIGVFVSCSLSSYFYLNLTSHLVHSLGKTQDEMLMVMGNEKDFAATRISYKLNLQGPSKTVQTACSSSLVAVHDACQSLLNFECDLALAGGVSINVPLISGYFYTKESINSPDGQCRPFDHKASGTLIGNGGAIVILKRLDEALNDHDNILAIIKGSAINNDGARKIGYTAPSIEGQARAIAMAHLKADVSPDTISYIECHGTGTIMGDPIEIEALTLAFRAQTMQKGYCGIGSVKSNIGHLDAAAGIAGFCKAILCLKNRQLVPSLHFEKINPKIPLNDSPFYVCRGTEEWRQEKGLLRAGVSSFGIGGTNAHIVLEEAPSVSTFPSSKSVFVLPFSAKTFFTLQKLVHVHCETLKSTSYLLEDVAFSLQVGRKSLEDRICFVVGTKEDAIKQMEMFLVSGHRSILEGNDLANKMAIKWMNGEKVDWMDLHRSERRRRVPLPTYVFEKKRYYIVPKPEISLTNTVFATPKGKVEQNKLEDTLLHIWKLTLKTDQVGIDDSFFALGGDSILALEINEILRKRFHIDLKLEQLLNHTSIRSLAQVIREEILKNVCSLY